MTQLHTIFNKQQADGSARFRSSPARCTQHAELTGVMYTTARKVTYK